LKSVQLECDTPQHERDHAKPNRSTGAQQSKSHPIRYNPDYHRLEWESIPFNKGVALEGSPGTRAFNSVTMRLNIGHPGELFATRELFQEQKLTIHADVEIDGYLLSGLEACYFGATGNRQPLRGAGQQQKQKQPKLTTHLSVDTDFYVADEFAKRKFTPYQQYVFDGVVPDERRITDIVTILNYSNFETGWEADPGNPSRPESPRWLLWARRQEGTSWLTLLIAIDGRKYSVDHEQLRNAGMVKETFDTAGGRVRVSVLGSLPRDHAVLTHEMNHLQQALRERFRYQQGS
jgi:hypothetical protein